MNRKLLFFDIDSTLLDGIPGSIPESAIEGLKQAQAQGHLLFINSGRTWVAIPKAIKDFPFDGYVLGCGTHIILKGKDIFHVQPEQELRAKVIDFLHSSGVQGALEGPEHIFFEDREDAYPPVAMLKQMYTDLFGPETLGSFNDPELNYDKFMILAENEKDQQAFRRLIDDDFDYIQREELPPYLFAEIVPKGCSKATGIDVIAAYLDADLDDCYVFGDSNNDLPMLNHVKHSIAMGNSYPDVLEAASYVTTPINRDGIRNALKHFHLIP